MNEEVKRNCNSCKLSFLDRCEKLKGNEDYQSVKNDILKSYEFKKSFICDNYQSRYIEYPIEVSKINANANTNKSNYYRDSQIGRFAKIRPCGEEYEDKTYLGLYLGELPVGHGISYNTDNKKLDVSFTNNPAIFVFDLNKIVYGMESWWGIIESKEDLKEITESDINNIWYVKALKELSNN